MTPEWIDSLRAEYAAEAQRDPYFADEQALFEQRARFSFYQGLNPLWLMDHGERAAMIMLLERIRPRVILEIGSRFAGATMLFAGYADKVHAFDLDPEVKGRCAPFDNVDVHIGDSKTLVPETLRQIAGAGGGWDLALVDGDHSAQGVRADLTALLREPPARRCWIVMHDSFNPECRKGLLAVDWNKPWVHVVELDFVFGNLMPHPHAYRRMWGGLCLAELRPEPREQPLQVTQTGKLLFEAALAHSHQSRPQSLWIRARGIGGRLRRAVARLVGSGRR